MNKDVHDSTTYNITKLETTNSFIIGKIVRLWYLVKECSSSPLLEKNEYSIEYDLFVQRK